MSMPQISANDPQPAWEIATLYPPQGAWSVEEYLDLTDGTNRLIEFTDGQIEFLEMPTILHQRILMYLLGFFQKYVSEHVLGEVFVAGTRIQVDPTKFREPDITVVRKGTSSDKLDRYWRGAELVVEIVRDGLSSRDRDLVKKRVDYATAGISEYWMVDPQTKLITVLALEGDSYAVHGEFMPGQQATSRRLEGFSIDVKDTFDAVKGP